jgi:predicted TIM-barrel fold metal-dependent hydrolase
MRIVDTHMHLWDLSRFPCSWCAGIPALNRSFLLPDYQVAIAGTQITKTVFMEADVDEPHALAEAAYVQSLARSQTLVRGIVASGRPEHPNFEAHLDALARLPLVRGLRRILHTQPDGLSEGPHFAGNLRRLPAYHFTFDLCVLARQLPLAYALAKACPEVTFILDHCGVPDMRSGALEPWKGQITRIAQLPNVSCKVSGLIAYVEPGRWTVETLRPWMEHVIGAFGWDRVVWGGDWPVCTLGGRLGEWVQASHELTRSCSETERDRLFHLNAERLYHV